MKIGDRLSHENNRNTMKRPGPLPLISFSASIFDPLGSFCDHSYLHLVPPGPALDEANGSVAGGREAFSGSYPEQASIEQRMSRRRLKKI